MKQNLSYFRFLFTIAMLFGVVCLNAQSLIPIARDVEIAKTYYEHGLAGEAKSMLLAIATDKKQPDSSKADALYWLGQITFEEGRYGTALKDWKLLTEIYPGSSQAIEIAARLDQLKDMIGRAELDAVSSLTAQAYMKNGDFWSEADNKFTIDNSWLPNVELAVAWYDRIISEFPKTKDAEIAYKRKMHTLLGWKEIGQYGQSYGAQADPKAYLPIVIAALEAFQRDFPESASLQGFRYQIGQVYWSNKNWLEAQKWFQTVVDSSNGQSTFYSETAKARLLKFKY